MRFRDSKLQIWLSNTEAEKLERHAAKAKMSKSAYIRSFINGYKPKEAPPLEYHRVIRELRAIGNNINQIAHRANCEGDYFANGYTENYREITALADELSRVFLPERKAR